MIEFYEPMLYLSTPEHPNTMGVLAVLTEAVDGELLRDAAGCRGGTAHAFSVLLCESRAAGK